MAVNIFDKYGIKEVANVYFEALDDDLAGLSPDDYSYVDWIQKVTSSSTYPVRYTIDLIIGDKEDFSATYDVSSVNDVRYLKTVSSPHATVVRLSNVDSTHNYVTGVFDGSTMDIGSVKAYSITTQNSYSRSTSGGSHLLPLKVVGDEQGPSLPSNWPDPVQPNPEPPRVPDPPDEPVPTPPELPTVDVDTNWPDVNVTVTVEPSNTTPADYTPWLRAILQVLNDTLTYLGTMLNALRADLNDHCYHQIKLQQHYY